MPVSSRRRSDRENRLAFFGGFLRHPRQVGSIIPSSRFLERRIVREAGAERAEAIVELGPGTGGTTRALLRAMRPDARLLGIELQPRFVKLLRELPDPRLSVHEGSAAQLAAALELADFPAPDVVLSGIPFSTIPQGVGMAIVRAVHASLRPGGRFVAYQVRDRVETLGERVFGAARVQRELRNVPPMRVYCWQKEAAPVREAAAATAPPPPPPA